LCSSGRTQAPDIVILDTPRGDLVEVASSSYDLSPFSSKVGSPPDVGARGASGGVIECKYMGALASDRPVR
jgi:hypothetical protein